MERREDKGERTTYIFFHNKQKTEKAIKVPFFLLFCFHNNIILILAILCSELGKLHKQLVIGRILTEDEFWATRKVDDFRTEFLNLTVFIIYSQNIVASAFFMCSLS